MGASAISTRSAAAKRAVNREGVTRSNRMRLSVADANPVEFLIAAMKGEPIGGEEAEDGTFPDGEVLPLKERVDIAKFLSNKVIATLAPQQLGESEGESIPAQWSKALGEIEAETVDAEVEPTPEDAPESIEPKATRVRGRRIKRRKPHKVYDKEG